MVTYKIKTYNGVHSCVRNAKSKEANAPWIATKLMNVLRATPNMTAGGMREELKKYGVNPPRMQLYRAKKKALEWIQGNHGDSYGKLPTYAHLVNETNQGSIVKIHYQMGPMEVVPSFKRIFVGFSALKQGFMRGCRSFLGFDGCHLKGPFGEVFLTGVGLDGNNGLFPIAFSVVESETKESWGFFFYWLSELLEWFSHEKSWNFMTDKQKVYI